MVKLLIVDDEPLVCVGLNSMLKWDELGIEVLGSAHNGQDAEDMIAMSKPDLVIADIKMPVMNGLELVERCAENYGRIPLFILLTSYEDFDYARQALKHGVVDYLIKLELTPESLKNSVEKALGILEEVRRIENIEQKSTAGGTKFLTDRFFLMLYNNLFESEQQYLELKNEAGIEFTSAPYAAAICELTEPSDIDVPGEKTAQLFENTMRMAYETISDFFCCYITPLNPRSFCIAVFLAEDEDSQAEPILVKTLTNMKDMLRGYLNVSVRIAVGFIVADPIHLTESYADAKRLLAEIDELHTIRFSDTRHGYRRHLIANVQKYICDNLQERISLNEAAAKFGLSPGYLSQLFTRITGKSYVEFITEARIAEAKKLLASGEYKVYEVADIFAFDNAFYFSKVFKKVEGISPREYLKQLFSSTDPDV